MARIEVELIGRDQGLTNTLSKANQATQQLGTSTVKTTQAATKAATNFQGFSRVLQDAAFGPAAIANNLEQLGQDFVNIGKTAKDTGQTIGQTLVASLAGGGGLNLALGALTLSLSLASFGLSAWTRLFPDAKKQADDAAESTKNYAETLSLVDQALLKGEQNAQKEINTLRILYETTQDTTLSIQTRQKAVDQLQQQFPSYFKNISDEAILNGQAKEAYDQLAESILASARARGGLDQLTENAKQELILERQIADAQAAQARIEQNREKAAAIRRAGSVEEVNQAKELYQTNALIGLQNQDAVENIQKLPGLQLELNRLKAADLAITKQIKKELEGGGTIVDLTTDADGESAESKLRKQLKELQYEIEYFSKKVKISGIGENVATEFATANAAIDGTAVKFQQFPTALDKLNSESVASLDRFNQAISERLVSATQLIGTFAESFGEALASGNFSNFGSDILNAVGSFLSQLGQMFIKEGTAQILYGIAKNLILPGSGAGNIAGGAGMIAAGAGLSLAGGLARGSTSNNNNRNGYDYQRVPTFPGFANGVTNFAGGLAIVGERGPELVNLPTGSSVIPNHSMSSYMQSGGGETVISLGIEQDKLIAFIDRGRRKLNRLGYDSR